MADKAKKKDRNSDWCKRIDTSRQVREFFRRQRVRAVSLYAGDQWSNSAEKKKRYINLIALYVNIMTRALYSANPKVALSTFDQDQKTVVVAAEQWLNDFIVLQDLGHLWERCAQESMFSLSTAYCALATPIDSANKRTIKTGLPILARVDQDDLTFDYEARDLDDVTWIADRFRGPIDAFKDSKFFESKKARDSLQPMSQSMYNREGDMRIHQLGLNNEGDEEDLEDTAEVWRCYFPREGVIRFYPEDYLTGTNSAWDGAPCEPLSEKPWVGPDRGPYINMAHIWIPGNLEPKGPVADLVDLDEGANESYRKLMREAAALKTVAACNASDPQDGIAHKKASDGDMIGVRDPKSIVSIRTGGPDAALFQWVRENIDRFMEMGGNVRTVGGLATQAGTLGQEELLAQQSSGQVSSMQGKMVKFVTKCCDSILWYYWEHPDFVMEAEYKNPNVSGVNYTRKVQPWNHPDPTALRRTGQKPSLTISPYSIRNQTPAQKMQSLIQIMTQVYQPFAPLAASQGVTPDMRRMFQVISKWVDMPELQELLSVGEPIPQGGSGEGSAPSSTSREYIRKDVGQPSGREDKMESDNAVAAMAAAGNGQSNGQLY